MRISRSDLAALLIALGAAVAGLVVWNHGTVDLGMTLHYDDERLRVQDVTPDGNAARNFWSPTMPLLEVTTTSGRDVERGDEIAAGVNDRLARELFPWPVYDPRGFEEIAVIQADHRLPIEAVSSSEIETAVAGELHSGGEIIHFATIDRSSLELMLRQSIWVSVLGLLLGAAVWRLLAHGLAGSAGRRHAMIAGAAVAAPWLIFPAVQVGTPAGIAAGFLVPIAMALLLGAALAHLHPDRQWIQTALAGSIVAAALAVILVARYLTAPSLAPSDRGTILFLVAAIPLVPAIVVALSREASRRERASIGSLALMPAAALTVNGPTTAEPMMAVVLLGLLVGWQLLPVEWILSTASAGLERARSRTPSVAMPAIEPAQVRGRDLLTYGLIVISVVIALASPVGGPIGEPVLGPSAIVIGIGLAALVGFAMRNGFLGEAWSDAAVPLAASVGVPVILANTGVMQHNPFAIVPTALAALSVAHVLALRHTDPAWRDRLMAGSVAVVGLIGVFGMTGDSHLAILLLGLVALVPGVPVAFAEVPGEPRAVSSRLEALAVALTPGAGATMLVPSIGLLLLGAWLVAMVVWRQFTLNPLLGMAQRTQLQRDLAVAAAETERARLAADLHDDAIQQLTMLVRKLDEAGQPDAAAEAREVADKLRAVVGDLRLPILDDLGAGAALEWLVERVEPLAGGSVKLERSDETRPPPNVELAVFRVAQEALTNAIKHGRPPIAVRYDVRGDGRVTLAVDDAGEGIGEEAAKEAPREGHFGLLNMQQRAEQIGALLDVRRWPAGGTRVALEWRPQGS